MYDNRRPGAIGLDRLPLARVDVRVREELGRFRHRHGEIRVQVEDPVGLAAILSITRRFHSSDSAV